VERVIATAIKKKDGAPVLFYNGRPVPVDSRRLKALGWFPGALVVVQLQLIPFSFSPGDGIPQAAEPLEVLEPPVVSSTLTPLKRFLIQAAMPPEGTTCSKCGALRRLGETGWYAFRDRQTQTTSYLCPTCGWPLWIKGPTQEVLVPAKGPDYIVIEEVLRRNVKNTYPKIPPYCYSDPLCTIPVSPAAHLVYWLRTKPGTAAAERRMEQEKRWSEII